MSRKFTTGQSPYTLLVANLSGGSDPSKGVAGNPNRIRSGFQFQHFPEVQRQANTRGSEPDPSTPGVDTKMGLMDYTAAPVPVAATATIVVADNDFTLPATLNIGQYTLVSGTDFTPGGSTALTATALAAVINALPEFSAPVPAASTITVTGPEGPDGNLILLEAIFEGAVANYTLTGFSGAEPTIGPPTIL